MITVITGVMRMDVIPKLKICPSAQTSANEHEDRGVFGMSLVRFQYHEARRPMRSTF